MSLALLLVAALVGAGAALGIRALVAGGSGQKAGPPVTVTTPGSDILLRSDNPQVLGDNAFALIQLHNYAEALPFARKAVRLALPGTPTQAYATFNLGLALLDLKRCSEALPILQRALTIEPASQHAYVQGKIRLARKCATR